MKSFVIFLLSAQVATVTSLGYLAHRQQGLHTARSAPGQSSLGNLRGLSRDETDDIFRQVGVGSHQAAVLTSDQSRFGSPFLAPLLQARGREGLKLGDGAPHVPIGDRCTRGITKCFSNSDCINGVCSCPRGFEEPGFPLLGCKGNSIADQLLGDLTGFPVSGGGLGGLPGGGGNSNAVGIGGICNDDRTSGRLTFCLDSSLCIRQADRIKRCVCSQGFTRVGNTCVNDDELKCTLDATTSSTPQIAYVDHSSNRTTSCTNGNSACSNFNGAQCGTVPIYGRVCCVQRRFNDPSATYPTLNSPCDIEFPHRCQELARCMPVPGKTNVNTCQCDVGYKPIFIGNKLTCRHAEYLKCDARPEDPVNTTYYAVLHNNNSPKFCENQNCDTTERCGISSKVIGKELVCCKLQTQGGVAGAFCAKQYIETEFAKVVRNVQNAVHPSTLNSGAVHMYNCAAGLPQINATCLNGAISFSPEICGGTPTTGGSTNSGVSACSLADLKILTDQKAGELAPFTYDTFKTINMTTSGVDQFQAVVNTYTILLNDEVKVQCAGDKVAKVDPVQDFQKFKCTSGRKWDADVLTCSIPRKNCLLPMAWVNDFQIRATAYEKSKIVFVKNGQVSETTVTAATLSTTVELSLNDKFSYQCVEGQCIKPNTAGLTCGGQPKTQTWTCDLDGSMKSDANPPREPDVGVTNNLLCTGV